MPPRLPAAAVAVVRLRAGLRVARGRPPSADRAMPGEGRRTGAALVGWAGAHRAAPAARPSGGVPATGSRSTASAAAAVRPGRSARSCCGTGGASGAAGARSATAVLGLAASPGAACVRSPRWRWSWWRPWRRGVPVRGPAAGVVRPLPSWPARRRRTALAALGRRAASHRRSRWPGRRPRRAARSGDRPGLGGRLRGRAAPRVRAASCCATRPGRREVELERARRGRHRGADAHRPGAARRRRRTA